jgi:hypothetical protein
VTSLEKWACRLRSWTFALSCFVIGALPAILAMGAAARSWLIFVICAFSLLTLWPLAVLFFVHIFTRRN